MDLLAITLLGQFQLRDQDRPVDSIRTSRQQSLLAYLLIHRGTPVDRGHLAFLFWPNSTDKQARSNLRTLLHRIRNRLPDADKFIEIDRATVTWRVDAPFVLDVAEGENFGTFILAFRDPDNIQLELTAPYPPSPT